MLGYLPSDDEWRAPNIYEDTAAGKGWQPGEFGKTASLPEHDVWFLLPAAHLQPLHLSRLPRRLPAGRHLQAS